MTDDLLAKQLDGKDEEINQKGYRKTPEFKELIGTLQQREGTGAKMIKILEDPGKYGFNIPLLKEYAHLIAINLADSEKEIVIVKLHEAYINDIYSEYRDDILEIFLTFFEKISDQSILQRLAALASQLLNYDPCNTSIRGRIIGLIRKGIPTYMKGQE